MEVHGADASWQSLNVWIHQAQVHGACMYCTQRGIDGCPCPLEQSCMATHGEHMEALPPMGLKGDSDEGGGQSYKVRGEVGH